MKLKHIIGIFVLLISLSVWAEVTGEYRNLPTEKVTWCEDGGDYVWEPYSGRVIYFDQTEAGLHRDTDFVNKVVYSIDLKFDDHAERYYALWLENGYPKTYRGHEFSEYGDYDITYNDPPCQVVEHVNVSGPIKIDERRTTCGTEFEWHGQWVDTSGIWKHFTPDTVYTLYADLTQANPKIRETVDFCVEKTKKEAFSYVWHGHTIHHQVVDTPLVIPGPQGFCDTIGYLTLLLHDIPDPIKDERTVCGGTPYTYNGKEYIGPNTFTYTIEGQYGCPQVRVVNYVCKTNTFRSAQDTIRDKEPFEWFGKKYLCGGIYIDTIPGAGGCDTLSRLTLIPLTNDYQEECKGKAIRYNNVDYKEDITFTEVIKRPSLVDSIVRHSFHFNPKEQIKSDPITICSNETYIWEYAPGKTHIIKAGNDGLSEQKPTVTVSEPKEGCKCCTYEIQVTAVFPKMQAAPAPIFKSKEEWSYDPIATWTSPAGHTKQVDMRGKTRHTLKDTSFTSPQGCADKIYQQTYISTDRVSAVDKYYLCHSSIKVDGKTYTTTGGIYSNLIQLQTYDSIHRFEILAYTEPDTTHEEYDTCYTTDNMLNPFYIKKYNKSYSSSTTDVFNYKYTCNLPLEEACDSAVTIVHVRIKHPVSDWIDTTYCGDSIRLSPRLVVRNQPEGSSIDFRDTIALPDCDSITRFRVTRTSGIHTDSTAYINPGDTIHWIKYPQGGTPLVIDITESGTYRNVFTQPNGCDSIDDLIVIKRVPFYDTTRVKVCKNELPYRWQGEDYYQSCQVSKRFPAQYGQDSIYALEMTVIDTVSVLNTVALYPKNAFPGYAGSTYNFNGHVLSHDSIGKIYSATLKRAGTTCDSIDQLTITTAHITYVSIDTCRSSVFDTVTLDKDTSFYRIRYTKALHLDSVVNYAFHLHDDVTTDTLVNLHKTGGSFTWHDITYTQPCIAIFDTTSVFGCDSIATLRLIDCTDEDMRDTTVYEYPCLSDTIIIDGKRITQDGTYYQLRTDPAGGCSSFICRVITFRRPAYLYDTLSVYEKDSVKWRGKYYKEPGIYYDNVNTIRTADDACDSIISGLVLKERIVLRIDTTKYILEENSHPYCHNTICIDGHDTTIVDTLRHMGKDSIYYSYHYVVVTHYNPVEDTYWLCQYHDTMISGIHVTEGNRHYQSLQKSLVEVGKDSIYRFYVYEKPAQHKWITREGCDSIHYDDKIFYYNPKKTYPDTAEIYYQAASGCDSIVHLVMTLYDAPVGSILDVSIPNDSIFEYHSHKYPPIPGRPDTVDYIRIDVAGKCDSIVELRLHHYDAKTGAYTYYYCKGDSIEISGKRVEVTKDMSYSDTTKSGNTTFIKVIRILVNQPFRVSKTWAQAEARAGKQVKFNVIYKTNGESRPNFYDVHFVRTGIESVPRDTSYAIQGIDSVYPITMKLANDECIYPGEYTYYLTFRSNTCFKQTDTLHLDVLYPAEMMYAKWNNTVAINKAYTDTAFSAECFWDLVPPFKWYYKDGEDKGGSIVTKSDPSQPYYYNGDNLPITPGTMFKFEARRSTYDTPVYSYYYTFQPETTAYSSTGKPRLTVTPTMVSKRAAVRIDSDMNGDYQLYNASGNKGSRGTVNNGTTTLQAPGLSGCYMLQVHLEDGTTQVEKLIVF